MKKSTISILIVAGTLILVFFFLLIKGKEKQRRTNPWEYSVEAFQQVDEALISHSETKRIRLGHQDPMDIAYLNGSLFVLFEKSLQIIDINGKEKQFFSWKEDEKASCMNVNSSGEILIAFSRFLRLYSPEGKVLVQSETLAEESGISYIAVGSDRIFAADGGRREVLIFDNQLNIINTFKGESGVSSQHGYILPGNQFSLRINAEGELWTTNPGVHQLQNYTNEGRLRGGWGDASFGPDGFSGCCNPSYFGFLSDGSFVTSEKGMVRVKIHRESGEFLSYVAPPVLFGNGKDAPAIAVDENDRIILLDFEQSLIRIFSRK